MATTANNRIQPQIEARKRIKVLHVATSGITFKALLAPLIDRLDSEGYDTHIVCSDGSHTRELMDRGYKITPITIERRIAPFSNLKSTWRLYRFISKEKFDIVHVHTPIASVVGRIAAKLAGTPLIIYTAHGFYFHERMRPRTRNVIIWVEQLLGRMTDMLMTQSKEDASTAITECISSSEDRVEWIGNGVDTSRFYSSSSTFRDRFGLSANHKLVGFVGRMVGEKGIVELIDAMAKVVEVIPDARLVLVGDTLDDDRDKGIKDVVRNRIEDHGLGPKIIFTGFMEDIPDAMAAFDVFVLPSHREGMPRTVIEAMASSKPVVATNIRGCREEVVDGETGFLVPVNDFNALSERIIDVLSNDQRAMSMGIAGRKRAEDMFDEELVLDREVEIYEQLVRIKLGEKRCL